MQYKQKLTEELIRNLIIEELKQAKQQNKETLQEGKVINSLLSALLAMTVTAANAKASESPDAAQLAKQMMALQQQVINNIDLDPAAVVDKIITSQGAILKDPKLNDSLKKAGENLKAAVKQQLMQKRDSKGPAETPAPAESPAKPRPRPVSPLPSLT